MSEDMKICPKCGTRQTARYRFCMMDGTELVPLEYNPKRNPVIDLDDVDGKEIIEITPSDLTLLQWILASWLRAVEAKKIRSVGDDFERAVALQKKLRP